jgi:CRISPR/Cas system-associated endonuclease Cas1
MVNRRLLRPEHFIPKGEAGVLLTDEGRELFLGGYEATMGTAFADPNSGVSGTFRDVLRRQARLMRDSIVGGGDYPPYRAEC